jgi:phage shock protein A
MSEEKPVNNIEENENGSADNINSGNISLIPIDDNSDLMIENLSGAEAKEYVVAWMQEEKRLQREASELESLISLWQERVTLATSRNMQELAAEAQTKLSEFISKKDSLELELKELSSKTELLKEKLRNHKEDIRTVDADWLLMDLENMLGKTIADITTETAFDKLDAQKTLSELKEKMNKTDSKASS